MYSAGDGRYTVEFKSSESRCGPGKTTLFPARSTYCNLAPLMWRVAQYEDISSLLDSNAVVALLNESFILAGTFSSY